MWEVKGEEKKREKEREREREREREGKAEETRALHLAYIGPFFHDFRSAVSN